jgi:hypothetical protein
MVKRDQMCIFPQAFQIIKPGHDISSNSRDIAIYVKTALNSISMSLFRIVESFFYRIAKLIPCHSRIYKPFINIID